MSTMPNTYEVPQPSDSVVLAALKLVMQDIDQFQGPSTHGCDDFDHPTCSLEVVEKEINHLLMAATSYRRIVERQIARSRRHRNLLASVILRCPNEILSKIFDHLVGSSQSEYYRDLHNIRLVCSRFYQICEATPRLWAQIGTYFHQSSVSVAAMLLKKSKNAPLDIIINSECCGVNPFLHLDVVSPHLHRWRTFDCTYDGEYVGDSAIVEASFECYTQSQAPLLREFTVKFSDSQFHSKRLDLFGSFAPNLQNLDVLPITMSWDSPILSGLTLLRISAWDGNHAPTSAQYLQVLLSCPALEELYLRGREADCREGSGADFYSIIPLSKLKTLSLKYIHPVTIRSLLSSIQSSLVNFTIKFPRNLADRWKEVIQETLLEHRCQHVLSKFNSSPSTMRLILKDHISDKSSIELDTSFDDSPSYQFVCAFRGISNPSLLYHTLFASSARTSIQTLVINMDTAYFGAFGLRELFEELGELRTLELTNFEILPAAVLAPLSIPVRSIRQDSQRWLCPHLHTLLLETITVDIHELWMFLSSRYQPADSIAAPTALSCLGVWGPETPNWDHIPPDIAYAIVNLIGKNVLIWDGCTFTRRGWERWHPEPGPSFELGVPS